MKKGLHITNEDSIRVICHACGERVKPKKISKLVRRGVIMSFYKWQFNCPRCGEERIYES